ncbi:hypothetical protein IOK49_00480 [Fervidicoccus fontis]|jgi:isopropylmalate/homocitrate/citramalate synthase|uniref:Uncharacterized protein n=2 Tax=Fervidicoccus fontis TaxID=683846 RepID=I0A2H8_FERFK|nr:hypothetical protein [Fervidicoccus fontis]AFH43185.1 hypothetical protein FFONT_1197 [Fervidicoccus fontis Kam940]MBE9390565.1 hypothetical protein [Fervidicoccus fontis]PMB75941.1 MAG: hypothetical protein C0188_01230 [Fervidicoccus fontis]PMB77430.1 MAG: hypothetical protein C0177_03355 [Fervidicoccus fontis]HEW63921.1 hypothetical protein [Fervidicoccus fontis]
MQEEYCKEPPCIHVVSNDRKKIFAVFFEDSEGVITWIENRKMKEALQKIREAESKGYREATQDELDNLAREKLGVEPIPEEEEEW